MRLLLIFVLVSFTLARRLEMEPERCEFSCPAGLRARAHPHHKPSFNGCGTGLNLIIIILSSLLTWFLIANFKLSIGEFKGLEDCCNRHDIDYDTCGKSRSESDVEFGVCLENVCAKLGPAKRAECQGRANLMKMGATSFGCQAYLDSQRNACECVKRIADSKEL
jgi:hypothetical protein